MTRAVLVPFAGDPFILCRWLSLYKNVWQGEISTLYPAINPPGHIPKKVIDLCMKMVREAPKTHVIDTFPASYRYQHGDSVTELLKHCKEDTVALLEGDAYVFKPGKMEKCFLKIERGETDIVGGPRGCCNQSMMTREADVFGLHSRPFLVPRPNWWPCYFFISRENLLKTDLNFNAKTWNIGERIEELDMEATTELLCGDTFVWASIQLRAMGLRDEIENQYHSYPHDLQLRASKEHLWDGNCKWVHIGSLSSTPDYFKDEETFRKNTEVYTKNHLSKCISTQQEFVRRISWIKMIVETTPIDITGIEEDIERYKRNLDIQPKIMGLSDASIQTHMSMYKELLPTNE
jgi:hypothetical protein